MRNFRKMTTAEKAGWLTAWATAIQTMAVSGALVVAFIEWQGHEAQDVLKKREAATKFFLDQPQSVVDARKTAKDEETCRNLGSHPVDQMIKALCDQLKEKDNHPNVAAPFERVQPMREYLQKIELCLRNEICERPLTIKLFCPDVRLLKTFDDSIFSKIVLPAPVVPMLTDCNVPQ